MLQYKFNNDYYNVSSNINDVFQGNESLIFGNHQLMSLGFKLSLDKYLKPNVYLANLNVVGVAS